MFTNLAMGALIHHIPLKKRQKTHEKSSHMKIPMKNPTVMAINSCKWKYHP